MRHLTAWIAWLALLGMAPPLAAATSPVALLQIDGAIGPASADFTVRGLARAAREGAQLAILQIDTPGGLDSSMRQIIKAILASPIPVAAYVAPSGARAASAGTYILYASHVAAMAPGTNLGAATPVQIGIMPGLPSPESKPTGKDGEKPGKSAGETPSSPMERKQVSDASAFIRGLAQLRGRNVEWAERAVREAASLSATEALKEQVIEFVATDVDDLLRQLDGKTVTVHDKEWQLHTAGAPLLVVEPDWRTRFLDVVANPSVALILMMIGIYGLLLEFASPGVGVAGVIGGICLILALYALQMLPVNYAGLALVLLGIAMMVAEIFAPSFGALGIGGVVAFVFGSLMLFDTESPAFAVPLGLIVTVALSSAVLIVSVGGMALKARRRAVVSGAEILIGADGRVIGDTQWASVQGENWRITADVPLTTGQQVRVVSRDGLVLKVVPVDNDGKGEGS